MIAPTPELTLPSADPESIARVRAKASGARATETPLLMLGTVLAGAYELEGLLGSGGMGQVFNAHDMRLERRVAVKVARAGVAGALRAEGRILAGLEHPSVVRVLHAGVHREVEYLVLEHIAGRSLRARMTAQRRTGAPFSLREAISLLRGIARSLDAVHRAALAHRDVKPENVMLRPDGRVVLTDFGLAVSESAHAEKRVSGSPSHMAPEAITGSVQPGSWYLVDLYALGIVAYELLAGFSPFDRGQWMKSFRAQLTEPPPDLRELRPDVPPSLAQLAWDLVAKDPHARPRSAGHVAQSLDLVRASLPAGTARTAPEPPRREARVA